MILRKGVVLILCTLLSPCIAAEPLHTKPPGYAVASAHPLATKAGLTILAQGGNAFDAAVAVAATLGVVAPYHSGLGGGGFWLLHVENQHKNVFVDAREVAPKAAYADMYLGKDGQIIAGLSLNGGLSAAIPGQPAALDYIAKQYGKLPLSQSLAPAIALADEGFLVDTQLRSLTLMGDRLAQLQKYPASAAVFLKEGKAYALGERLVQKDLAHTLKALAARGKEAFYRGSIAKSLVKAVNAAGGIWTLSDLSDYTIKIREPLVGAYHNMLVITAPPPSAGGISLLTMLNILSPIALSEPLSAQWVHDVVESMRLAYWQREQLLGDPDFVAMDVDKLISADNANRLRKLIPGDKPINNQDLSKQKPLPEKSEGNNTTHFSIIDAEGNRVAATLTVNFIFGSSVVAEGTGVLLNDEMDDFSSKSGQKNVYGVIGSISNAIGPGRRPVSSMTPTFLELPNRLAVLGTPGGSRIPTMVLLAALVFDQGFGPISMVSAMRFHHQYLPDKLQFEPDTFSSALQASLQAMGYDLMPLNQYYGDMQALTWDREKNWLHAISDPRHIGLATAVVNDTGGYGIKY